jgi:hypothetical protein
MDLARVARASQQHLVEQHQIVDPGHRCEPVPASETHLVLNISFLMTRIRVAEPGLEPVTQPEPPEQLGLPDHVHHPAAYPSGVIEHHHWRHTTNMREHIKQPLTHALCGLPTKHLREPLVRVRERHHKKMTTHTTRRFVEIGFPEINPRQTRFPNQVIETTTGMNQPVLFPPPLHVTPHR